MLCWFYFEFRNWVLWVTICEIGYEVTKHSKVPRLALRLPEASLTMFLGRGEQATLVPNYIEAAGCDRRVRTLHSVLYMQSHLSSWMRLSLEIQYIIDGIFSNKILNFESLVSAICWPKHVLSGLVPLKVAYNSRGRIKAQNNHLQNSIMHFDTVCNLHGWTEYIILISD